MARARRTTSPAEGNLGQTAAQVATAGSPITAGGHCDGVSTSVPRLDTLAGCPVALALVAGALHNRLRFHAQQGWFCRPAHQREALRHWSSSGGRPGG